MTNMFANDDALKSHHFLMASVSGLMEGPKHASKEVICRFKTVVLRRRVFVGGG